MEKISIEKLKETYQQWEHLAGPLFFVFGFFLDILTLGRIDELLNILMLLFYLLISAFIFFWELEVFKLNFLDSSTSKVMVAIKKYRDEIFHFCQGALLSAFTLFYFKSASLATSLVFLSIMFILLLINELPFLQKKGPIFKGILFQVSLFSFVLVYLPLLFGQVGVLIFIAVLFFYALLVGGFFLLLKKKLGSNGDEPHGAKDFWLKPGLSLMALMIVLRSLSLVPPVPLSLEMAGIYHKVEKRYPLYDLYHQKEWWRFWNNSDEYFRAAPGDKIYFFTRVFAPGGFNDQVYLKWQTKINGDWKTSDRIPFKINGGRDQGFRGYAYKSNYTAGDWRVLVETKGGLEIGRLNFEVEMIQSENQDPEKDERVFKRLIDGKS